MQHDPGCIDHRAQTGQFRSLRRGTDRIAQAACLWNFLTASLQDLLPQRVQAIPHQLGHNRGCQRLTQGRNFRPLQQLIYFWNPL